MLNAGNRSLPAAPGAPGTVPSLVRGEGSVTVADGRPVVPPAPVEGMEAPVLAALAGADAPEGAALAGDAAAAAAAAGAALGEGAG